MIPQRNRPLAGAVQDGDEHVPGVLELPHGPREEGPCRPGRHARDEVSPRRRCTGWRRPAGGRTLFSLDERVDSTAYTRRIGRPVGEVVTGGDPAGAQAARCRGRSPRHAAADAAGSAPGPGTRGLAQVGADDAVATCGGLWRRQVYDRCPQCAAHFLVPSSRLSRRSTPHLICRCPCP
jgi:hypothetical protein